MLTPARLLVALVLVLAPAIPAAPEESCRLPDGAVGQLLDWIEQQTDYDASKARSDPPAIVTCATGDVIDYAHEATIVDQGIHGLYDFDQRRIYLIEPWEYDNLLDRSVLLHELFHAVQLDNREWDCVGAPEWEAYKLQEAWLAEHGLEADFDWIEIYFWSRCPKDIHPD